MFWADLYKQVIVRLPLFLKQKSIHPQEQRLFLYALHLHVYPKTQAGSLQFGTRQGWSVLKPLNLNPFVAIKSSGQQTFLSVLATTILLLSST
jgi:hypothetical protein